MRVRGSQLSGEVRSSTIMSFGVRGGLWRVISALRVHMAASVGLVGNAFKMGW